MQLNLYFEAWELLLLEEMESKNRYFMIGRRVEEYLREEAAEAAEKNLEGANLVNLFCC
jgi:hypothetical protein